MTYSSRNFLISCGTGSDDRAPPRASNRLSSAMMSLQTSTHSSQMKTVGPAISLRTSFWSLLQNEQRRISPSPVFFTIWDRLRLLRPLTNYVINNTVFLALIGPHDVVPLGILLDALERLAGVLGEDLVQPFARAKQFARVNIDVGRLPSETLHPWLMDQDPRVGERVPLALGPGRQQDRGHRGRLPDAGGRHVRLDELHGVVNRQASRHDAPGAVDIQEDVPIRVLGLQE